jgi:hypothetical protein
MITDRQMAILINGGGYISKAGLLPSGSCSVIMQLAKEVQAFRTWLKYAPKIKED